ncbi:hypothetical protein [Streptomyces uncialis]|nr:hypothetical protein [Streptomyces uncialis]
MTAHVQRQERLSQERAQLTRERRTALLLATHGLDIGPHVIHGKRLPA